MSIEVTEIFCSQSAHLLKLNHFMYLMNLPTVLPFIELNKYLTVYN